MIRGHPRGEVGDGGVCSIQMQEVEVTQRLTNRLNMSAIA